MSELKLRWEKLDLFIKASENRIEIDQRAIDEAISANGVYMLNNDQARQSEFMQVDSMLYPRLLFSDNMEDKGMEPERAANFQRSSSAASTNLKRKRDLKPDT